VIVVEELAAEFEVELVLEQPYPLEYLLRLQMKVLVNIKPD